MISKNEMKNYFLRANYHALKSEFKHDFHEFTYMKPAFCTHCEGFVRENLIYFLVVIYIFFSISYLILREIFVEKLNTCKSFF